MSHTCYIFFFFFFNDTATTEIYTLSLHDALPIWNQGRKLTKYGCTPILTCQFSIGPLFLLLVSRRFSIAPIALILLRSEEHTSELQSPCNLVCRLLLEKKKHILCHHGQTLAHLCI